MANPKIQLRHDIKTNWESNNPVLLKGEVALETDSNNIKIGNGRDNYNNLPYFISVEAPLEQIININPFGLAIQSEGIYLATNNEFPFTAESNTTTKELKFNFDINWASGETNNNVALLILKANSDFTKQLILWMHINDNRFSIVNQGIDTSSRQIYFDSSNLIRGKDYNLELLIKYDIGNAVTASLTIKDAVTSEVVLNNSNVIVPYATHSTMDSVFANGMQIATNNTTDTAHPILYKESITLVRGFGYVDSNIKIFKPSSTNIVINYDNNTLQVVDNKLTAIMSNKTLLYSKGEFPLNLTSNGTIGGTTPACSGSSFETGYPYYYAFKGGPSTTSVTDLWGPSSSSDNQYLLLYIPDGIVINSLEWTNGGIQSEMFPTLIVKGSNDNRFFDILTTYNCKNPTIDSTSFANHTKYKYYRFEFPTGANYGKFAFISIGTKENHEELNIGTGLKVEDNNLRVDGSIMPDYANGIVRTYDTWYKTTNDVVVIALGLIKGGQVVAISLKDQSGNFVNSDTASSTTDLTSYFMFEQCISTVNDLTYNSTVWAFIPRGYSYKGVSTATTKHLKEYPLNN